MGEPVPVVIVGAGPTGVTAALLLAGYGVRSVLLDRWSDVYPRPRAVHLDDEVCRILQQVGVYEQFAALSRPARGLRLLAPDHRVLAEFRRDAAAGVHGHPQANLFDQPELERLLRRRLTGQPLITLRGDVEVTDVGWDASGRAWVRLVDRTSRVPERVATRFVLGCDGANSTVRTSVGATMRDLGFAQRWMVVDVDTDVDINAWAGVHQVCDPRRPATYLRVGPTRHRWEFRLWPGESPADLDLPELVRPWLGAVPFGALRVVRRAEYTFRAQVADRWRAGPVFLLGDAAHLTPPFVGQGLGAGLRDAVNLAWKLAAVLAGELPERALDSYQVERQPHVTALIRLAVLVGRVMTAGGELGDLVRRVVVPYLGHLPGLRARVLDSATPPLSPSALCRRRRSPGSRHGRLCPNVLLADGRRFDEVVGARFAVVTVRAVSARVCAVARDRGVALVSVASTSVLGRWVRRAGVDAVLVRPDRTVMASGRRVAALVAQAPLVWADHRHPPVD